MWIDFVDTARARAAVANQAGVLENAQVLRDGRAGNRKQRSEMTDGTRMGGQQLKYGQASGVAEGLQSGGDVSIHLR